jgi:hypothetical protein
MVNYDNRQTRILVKVSAPKGSSRPIQHTEYAEYNLVISLRRASALLWTEWPLGSRNMTFTLTKWPNNHSCDDEISLVQNISWV